MQIVCSALIEVVFIYNSNDDSILLPNALLNQYYTFLTCSIILQLLGKRATEKNFWPVNKALLTGHVTNEVLKHRMSRCQRQASVYCWHCFGDLKQLGNKTVISRLLGEQSNHCPSVVKMWENNLATFFRSSPVLWDNSLTVPRVAMKQLYTVNECMTVIWLLCLMNVEALIQISKC